MRLTVAICTYNPSPKTLGRVLAAIAPQLESASATELLVIDNNSSPPLAESGYLSAYPAARLISEPTPGLTAAREAAIAQANGDVILFVDDDNILGEGYLAGVIEAFSADPDLGLVGGRVVPEYETPPPPWFDEFEPWLAIRRHPPHLRMRTTAPPLSEFFPIGAGLAVRRDLAAAYVEDCAQSARIEGRRGSALSSGEDLDLALFVLSRGSTLLTTGALCLTHVISDGRTSRAYLERLAVSNIASALEIERKWSHRFKAAIHPMFSIPLPPLFARIAISGILGLLSPKYKVKRRIYVTLAGLRRAAPAGNLPRSRRPK